MLGAGESGKSTIFKQMKIMHNSGYNKEEREAFREIIFGNIVKAMKVLVAASLSLDIPVEEPENRERAEHINNMDNEVLVNVLKVWNEALAKDIDKLWNDNGIRKTFERRNEFQLDDSAPYYFNDLARISAADYLPSEQDVLRSRVKTTGIVETEFKLNNQSVKMIDVGGQVCFIYLMLTRNREMNVRNGSIALKVLQPSFSYLPWQSMTKNATKMIKQTE